MSHIRLLFWVSLKVPIQSLYFPFFSFLMPLLLWRPQENVECWLLNLSSSHLVPEKCYICCVGAWCTDFPLSLVLKYVLHRDWVANFSFPLHAQTIGAWTWHLLRVMTILGTAKLGTQAVNAPHNWEVFQGLATSVALGPWQGPYSTTKITFPAIPNNSTRQ